MLKSTNNKTIKIKLEEEKFYFPGEIIKGNVIIHPSSPIKVNWIQLKFYGKVCLHLKEKEVTSLFEDSCPLYPNESHKPTTLTASEYSFPFSFTVPTHIKLPSSMQFGKKCFVRYTISALLNRPMLPESLCPQTEYNVSLLEFIDIQQSQFVVPQTKTGQVLVSNQKCIVKAYMSRLGFTRGDIVPLNVSLFHFTPCSRKKGIRVELLRNLEIRTLRHTVTKETVLKSTEYDMVIDYTLQQFLTCQLLVPTSTPPSIRYKDKLLRFHYRVKLTVFFTDKTHCILDLPIVIGTWPRAAIPIDDEEGDTESLDVQSVRTIEGLRNSVISDVGRSNSVKSYNSISSWNSWDNRTTTLSAPPSFPHDPARLRDVPTHILEPITQPSFNYASSSTTEDSDEEDLLAILKKKKKKEQKELQKKLSQLEV